MKNRKTRTTEITVERSEIFIVRKPTRLVRGWCAQCVAEVKMVTAEEAAAIAHVSTRTIYALAEAGRIHFTETAQELLLICLKSLSENDERRTMN
jgi:hypothetical protein